MFEPRKNKEVPQYRRSWMSAVEGYDIFIATEWRKDGSLGRWRCGYCQKMSTDALSSHQSHTLADCNQCGRTNRISL